MATNFRRPQYPPPRPLLPIVVAFIIGIILADKDLLTGRLCWGGILGISVCFGVLYLINRLKLIRLILILFICLLAGGLRYHRFYYLPADHIGHFPHQDVVVTLTGIVIDELVITEERKLEKESRDKAIYEWHYSEWTRGYFTLRTETISVKSETHKITGLVRVNFSKFTPEVLYGDRVEIRGKLSQPRPASNPGQFDYRHYLHQQGIYKILYLVKPEDLKVIEKGRGNLFLQIIAKIRHFLCKKLDENFTSRETAFLKAFLLGRRDVFPSDLEDIFQRSGTIHFIAVSGLHIVIFLAFFWWLANFLGFSHIIRSIFLILLTIFYVALTGFLTPTTRAGVMALVYFSAELFGRKQESINSLALASLLILLYNPNEIFQIGFQLSFITVLMILLFSNYFQQLFRKKDYLLDQLISKTILEKIISKGKTCLFGAIAVSLVCWIGSAPIVINTFHLFCPITILANILLGILMWFILILGTLILLPAAVIGIGFCVTPLMKALLFITEWLASQLIQIPGAYFYLPQMPSWLIFVYYGVILLWFLRAYFPKLRLKYLITLSTCVIVCFISWMLIVLVPLFQTLPKGLILTMIDVRQGASFFLETPDGKRILYDAGNLGTFDAGKYIIAPFIWQKGLTKIDMLILSHPHKDHINNVPSLLERFRINAVGVAKSWFSQDSQGRSLLEIVQRKGIQVIELKRGDIIQFASKKSPSKTAEKCIIKVLGPPSFEEVEKMDKAFKGNDLSVVLGIKYMDKQILLTGDIEQTGISWLKEIKDDLKSEVMQIPHHGYENSFDLELLERVKPRYGLINASRSHSDRLCQRYKNLGVELLTSYEHGAVFIEITQDQTMANVFLKE